MEVLEAIKKRRSVRSFSTDDVPKDDMDTIVKAASQAPSGHNSQSWKFIVLEEKSNISWFKGLSGLGWVASAPALILITLDPTTPFWREDGAAAIQNLMLAATSLGYGACWVQGQIEPFENQIKHEFGIPKKWRVLAVIPVGKPHQWPAEPPKKSLSEVMSRETF